MAHTQGFPDIKQITSSGGLVFGLGIDGRVYVWGGDYSDDPQWNLYAPDITVSHISAPIKPERQKE